MLCPRCGQSNDDSNQNCAVCRAPLVPNAAGQRPAVGRLSRGFYVGSIAGAGLAGALVITLGTARLQRNPYDLSAFPFLLLGEMILVYAAVVFAVLLYKSWKAIQDGHARTTPGKAVGYLFIPFYNFYWAFQAYWGFAKDYNRFVDRHGVAAPPQPEGLYLASCVMVVASLPLAFIPVIKHVAPFASWALWILIANSMCDGVNRLAGGNGPTAGG